MISSETVRRAVNTSKRDLIENIFDTALNSLSQRDKDFLTAMSKDPGNSKISDIQERMKVGKSYAQKYRIRLIETGVISPVGRGELAFAIPYLGEYLRGEF